MPRFFEVLICALGVVLLSPLYVVLALSVKFHDGGTVLYKAKRMGKDGKPFLLYKFRTMVPNAESMGGAITSAGDSRITRVGKVLRKYKLDELPQLLNVLKGDMSLVGARPEDPRYIVYYTNEFAKILRFRPGITSPASICYRDEESLLNGPQWHERYVNEILPRKLNLDLDYLLKRSFGGDLKIILQTLGGLSHERQA
jgi:lipopolysaccharide/colanic/teichoic acid biosynthesis glycosyltransferase